MCVCAGIVCDRENQGNKSMNKAVFSPTFVCQRAQLIIHDMPIHLRYNIIIGSICSIFRCQSTFKFKYLKWFLVRCKGHNIGLVRMLM